MYSVLLIERNHPLYNKIFIKMEDAIDHADEVVKKIDKNATLPDWDVGEIYENHDKVVAIKGE